MRRSCSRNPASISEEALWKGVDVRVIDGSVNGAVGCSQRRQRPSAARADRIGPRLRGLAVRLGRGDDILGKFSKPVADRLVPVQSDVTCRFRCLTSLVVLPAFVGALLLLSIVPDEPQRHETMVHCGRRADVVSAVGVRGDAAALEPLRSRRRAISQFVERHAWIPAFGITYAIGVDGISLLLIVLTGFLTPIALLCSWESVHKKTRAFCMCVLLLESAMIGVFVSVDLFLFYVFWDAMLIPMYFPHRDLGLRPARVRCGEVHSLHDGRQRADAAGDSRVIAYLHGTVDRSGVTVPSI